MSKATENVLFITADQWRGECLSALGHPIVNTPNLDALAAEGTLFRRHYSQPTPCGPARASLYTGLYLHNHRSVTNGTTLDDRHANIAREVRKAGYDPALFGFTDFSTDPRGRGHTPCFPRRRVARKGCEFCSSPTSPSGWRTSRARTWTRRNRRCPN